MTDGTGAVVAAINVSMRVGLGSGDVEQPDRRVVPALQRCAAALAADVVASGRSGFPSWDASCYAKEELLDSGQPSDGKSDTVLWYATCT